MAVVRLDADVNRASSPAPVVLELDRHRRVSGTGTRSDIFNLAERHATDRRTIAPGMELFAEGEASAFLYVVLDGWLLLHRILEDGRRQILDFALPGAVVGYRPSAETPFAFSAETITPVEAAVIPLSRIDAMLREGSECGAVLLSAINETLLSAFESLTDVGRRTAREAVAHFLLRMDDRIRRTGQGGGSEAVPFPLTQEHVGDALGLTAVHVCRTLRALRADGLVEAGGGRLRIKDARALADEAGLYSVEPDTPRLAS